ncbi:MAG: hypothetical protein VW270_07050 [Candidatus Poseidoniales archaeon]
MAEYEVTATVLGEKTIEKVCAASASLARHYILEYFREEKFVDEVMKDFVMIHQIKEIKNEHVV